jgi:hypothetical protein
MRRRSEAFAILAPHLPSTPADSTLLEFLRLLHRLPNTLMKTMNLR